MKLYDFQEQAVQRALDSGGRWIFGDEMGLGKTPQAIKCMQRKGCRTALIVCPALVRRNWVHELGVWWPDHPRVGLIEYGLKRKLSKKKAQERVEAYKAPIQIVSYSLLQELDAQPYDAIIFDEAHLLQNSTSIQGKAAFRLVQGLGNKALRLALTATPIPDQPRQIWNILDLLWPNRFGKRNFKYREPWVFASHYMEEKVSQYGTSFSGLNPEHAKEFRQRLSFVHSRTTKAEVAHLLPPFDVKMLRIATENEFGLPFIDPERYSWRKHDERQNAFQLKAGSEKVQYALEWLENCEADHICIMAHHREIACNIYNALPRDERMKVYIDGDTPIQERLKQIKQLTKRPKSILIATIQSLGIGIDLTAYTQTLFVQLHPRPEVMLQALGRFSRLSGKLPSTVWLLCLEGTLDESQVSSLKSKIDNINQLLSAGRDDSKLRKSMNLEPERLQELVEKAITVPEEWAELEEYFE